MEGGTYHRAIEAGLDEELATFLTHMTMDVKNEIWQEWDKAYELRDDTVRRMVAFGFSIGLGFGVGLGIVLALV